MQVIDEDRPIKLFNHFCLAKINPIQAYENPSVFDFEERSINATKSVKKVPPTFQIRFWPTSTFRPHKALQHLATNFYQLMPPYRTL